MNPPLISIRQFEQEDAAECARLFYEAVHQLAERFYSPAQCLAWAPELMSADTLRQKLAGQSVLVAEDERGIAGFMSLRLQHELDFAYIRPDCAGKGVAGALYDAIVLIALSRGSTRLHTRASELARRFFARRGFKVNERVEFEHNGVLMHNYAMSTEL